MSHAIDRRSLVKAAGALGLGAGLGCLGPAELPAAEAAQSAPHAAKLGWRLACCAYTFNRFTFAEAVEKTAALGLKCIEGFTWQPLSKKDKVQTSEAMPAEALKEMKAVLAGCGVKLVSCYLSELPNKEDVCRKKFDWGKQLGLEYFVAEPPKEAFDLLAKLCDEYGICVAIHNHPKPHSVYWDPQTVAEVSKGRTKRIGACADTGHWVRSGLHAVECLKKLEGRLIGLHLKDIAEVGKVDSPDVPWGTGRADIRAILKEIHRQGAKPVFGIEYERFGPEAPAEIAQSIAFFDRVAAELA